VQVPGAGAGALQSVQSVPKGGGDDVVVGVVVGGGEITGGGGDEEGGAFRMSQFPAAHSWQYEP